MRCPKCRAELEENAVFCTNCGIEIESYIKWSPDYQERQKKDSASQTAEPENFENLHKPEKLESLEKPEPEKLESIGKPEPEKLESIEKPEPQEPESCRKPKRKEPRAFREPKTEAIKESKHKRRKNASFDETFYQQKERFNAKKFFKKHFKAIIGTVLILAAVIFAAIFVYHMFFAPLDNVIAIYDENNNENSIYLNTKKVGTVHGYAQIFDNMDRSAFYIMDGKSTAWYIKGNKLVEVMKDCKQIVVANHGKTALLTDKQDILYRYSGSELEKITEKEVYNMVVSGNGDYYSYTVSDGDEYDSYIGKEPDKEKKVENIRIFAISEKGRYFYGLGRQNYLQCINRKGEGENLARNISVNTIMLNEDGTEIMFVMEDETYISVKGKVKKKVADYAIEYVYGRETGNKYSYIGSLVSGLYCVFYPIDTFQKSAGFAGENDIICLISDSYEAEEIARNVSEIYGIDKNASRIYYEKISVICNAKMEKDAEENRLTEYTYSVYRGYFSKDSEDIYFVTKDSIGHIKKDGEIEYADIEINSVNLDYVARTKDGLYIELGNNFFYVKGRKVKELKNIKGLYCDKTSGRVYAYTRKQLYEVKNGNMKKLKGDFNKIYYITGDV